jgi:hypothetical protein
VPAAEAKGDALTGAAFVPVLLALHLQQHQLQDDHYDSLLSRHDFLRQSARRKARVADRRRELTGG